MKKLFTLTAIAATAGAIGIGITAPVAAQAAQPERATQAATYGSHLDEQWTPLRGDEGSSIRFINQSQQTVTIDSSKTDTPAEEINGNLQLAPGQSMWIADSTRQGLDDLTPAIHYANKDVLSLFANRSWNGYDKFNAGMWSGSNWVNLKPNAEGVYTAPTQNVTHTIKVTQESDYDMCARFTVAIYS